MRTRVLFVFANDPLAHRNEARQAARLLPDTFAFRVRHFGPFAGVGALGQRVLP